MHDALALVRRILIEQGCGSLLCSLLMSVSVSVRVFACFQASDNSGAFGTTSNLVKSDMSGLPAITFLRIVLLQIALVCFGVLLLMLCQDHVNAEEVPCD
jgi:hypothetical protein